MNRPLPTILIGGQSNAVGCTDLVTLDPHESHGEYENVYLYQEGNFTSEAKHKILKGIRIGMGCKSHQMGIEYGMASQLNELGSPLSLIRFAYGGTDLGFHWNPRYSKVPATVEEEGYCCHEFIGTVRRGLTALREAGFAPTVKGMVWMQGESDTNKTLRQAEQYQENLSLLFETIRRELSLPDLKILVGGISTVAPLAPFSDLVREKQKRYCQTDPLARYLDNSDLPMGADGWHYSGNDCLKLGKRFGMQAKEFFELR